MNPLEDAKEILSLVEDKKNWTPELFERCRDNTLVSPCIHNQIRKMLPSEKYRQFDDAYSFYFLPEQKGVVKHIREENKQKEGEEGKWRTATKYSLRQNSDRQLLSLLNQLKENGQL